MNPNAKALQPSPLNPQYFEGMTGSGKWHGDLPDETWSHSMRRCTQRDQLPKMFLRFEVPCGYLKLSRLLRICGASLCSIRKLRVSSKRAGFLFFEVSRLHVHISSHWDGSSSYQPLTIRDDDLSTFNEKTNLFRVHEWHEVDASSPYVPFSLFPYGVPNIRSCRGKRPEVSSTWGHRDPKDQRNKNVQTLSGYD